MFNPDERKQVSAAIKNGGCSLAHHPPKALCSVASSLGRNMYMSSENAGTAAQRMTSAIVVPLPYFFLPAIGLAGPLRVRALVWVR